MKKIYVENTLHQVFYTIFEQKLCQRKFFTLKNDD